MKPKKEILLIEDNEGDILLTKEAFIEIGLSIEIKILNDGQQAIKYLRKEAEFKNAETPDIILLDLNIPKVNGLQVLQTIKNDQLLKVIPVVILSTSNSEKDRSLAYRNHANCYFTKPVNFSDFINLIHMITNFWMNPNQLPKLIN
ncbi:MAG: response regulator [Ginsengibacter sp.]